MSNIKEIVLSIVITFVIGLIAYGVGYNTGYKQGQQSVICVDGVVINEIEQNPRIKI